MPDSAARNPLAPAVVSAAERCGAVPEVWHTVHAAHVSQRPVAYIAPRRAEGGGYLSRHAGIVVSVSDAGFRLGCEPAETPWSHVEAIEYDDRSAALDSDRPATALAEQQLRDLHAAGTVTLRVSRSWAPCVVCTYRSPDGDTIQRIGGATVAIDSVHRAVFARAS